MKAFEHACALVVRDLHDERERLDRGRPRRWEHLRFPADLPPLRIDPQVENPFAPRGQDFAEIPEIFPGRNGISLVFDNRMICLHGEGEAGGRRLHHYHTALEMALSLKPLSSVYPWRKDWANSESFRVGLKLDDTAKAYPTEHKGIIIALAAFAMLDAADSVSRMIGLTTERAQNQIQHYAVF